MHSRFRLLPPPLAPGARVALVAPAGPLRDVAELERAKRNARVLGWEPVVGAHALDQLGYFAGTDADRAADFNVALNDSAIDGIWCLRGGYGAMRILPAIDYEALRATPRAIIGFSDITALHAAIGEGVGIVTYHGPTARGVLTEFSRASLERAVSGAHDPCGIAGQPRVTRPGIAGGRLAGGNLALLAALCGTPYFPDLNDTLLVLEDVNEPTYRVDRMLRQLLLAGVLDGVQGIIFGDCGNCAEESDIGARPLDDVVTEIADAIGVPCVLGVPVGHIDEQWTIPLGAFAELDAAGGRLTVSYSPT